MSDEAPLTPRAPALQPVTEDRELWERLPGEPEDAWACFRAYREMDSPRRMHMSGHLGGVKVATATLSKWYRVYRWEERTSAYDVLRDRIVAGQRKKILEQAAEEVTADHLAVLKDLRSFLALEVKKALENAQSTDAPVMKPAELKGLIEVSVKMDRLARGETTEEVGVQGELASTDLDEIRALRERFIALKNRG